METKSGPTWDQIVDGMKSDANPRPTTREIVEALDRRLDLQERQIEYLRDRLRSTSDHFGTWIEGWPSA